MLWMLLASGLLRRCAAQVCDTCTGFAALVAVWVWKVLMTLRMLLASRLLRHGAARTDAKAMMCASSRHCQ